MERHARSQPIRGEEGMSEFQPKALREVTVEDVVDDTFHRYPRIMCELKRQEDEDRTALREMKKK